MWLYSDPPNNEFHVRIGDLRIGYFGRSFGAIELQPLGGVLSFVREHPQVTLSDFTFPEEGIVDDAPIGPPWKGRVDGVILASGYRGDVEDRLAWLAGGGVPVVAVTSDLIDRRLPAVFTDPVSVARLAVRELDRVGCRRVIHLGSRLSMASPLRSEAVRAQAERARMRFESIDLPYGPEELAALADSTSTPELVEALRPAGNPAGAVGVVTLNDHLARFVLQAATAADARVPDQVAVVSPDDTSLTFDRTPTITSIATVGHEVGRRAMEVLVRQIESGRRRRTPLVVPRRQLIRRQSTGNDVEPDDLAVAVQVFRREACSGKSVDEIIESLPLARRTLERRFRERFGQTPLQVIFNQRLSQAKLLLAHTLFTTQSIAGRTGFHDHAALSRFFRSHTGMSPTEYRQLARKLDDSVAAARNDSGTRPPGG